MTQSQTSWLKFWCFYNAALGIAMALTAIPGLDRPLVWLLDLVYWPFDGNPDALARETRLAAGIAGAVLAGWMVIVYGLVSSGTLQTNPALRKTLLWSLALWFVLDSVQSAANGALLNVALNAVILAGFVVPLWKSDEVSANPAMSR
jgi:hypothetical protein